MSDLWAFATGGGVLPAILIIVIGAAALTALIKFIGKMLASIAMAVILAVAAWFLLGQPDVTDLQGIISTVVTELSKLFSTGLDAVRDI